MADVLKTFSSYKEKKVEQEMEREIHITQYSLFYYKENN